MQSTDKFASLDDSKKFASLDAPKAPQSPSPKTIMSVPIPSEKSKLDQITSHYGLTEDDLINHKLPPKLNKTDFKIESDNDYSRPFKRHKSSCKSTIPVKQLMDATTAFNYYLNNHRNGTRTSDGFLLRTDTSELNITIKITNQKTLFTIQEAHLPRLESDPDLLLILADIFQFNDAYSDVSGQRMLPSFLIIQNQAAPQFTPLACWDSDYGGYEFNLENLNEHLTAHHLSHINGHKLYPSNAWITIGDDVDSALYIRINKAPLNQSTIAVTESTKASIFGDSFDEHQFLPTFRLIALDSKGMEQCVGSGQLLPNQTFLFHTIDAFESYGSQKIVTCMEQLALTAGANKIILYDAAKIMTKTHKLFYSIAYSIHPKKQPFYLRYNYTEFSDAIAILDGGDIFEFVATEGLKSELLYRPLMDEDSWDTLSKIIKKDVDEICSKKDKKTTIHATWISLIDRQQETFRAIRRAPDKKTSTKYHRMHNKAFKTLALFLNGLIESTRNKQGANEKQMLLLQSLHGVAQPRAYIKNL